MRLSLVIIAIVGLVGAAPSVTHVVHEKRDGEPLAWTKHARAAKIQPLPVRIGLKQQNLEHIGKHLDDVSDPDSPNFGKHWSAAKVASTFAPLKETSDRTIEWLVSSGIDISRIKHSAGRNWVEFDSTVEEAEILFNTKYHVYKHKDSEGMRVACDEYSLPHNVREHIDFVMPTIQLDGLKPIAQKLTTVLREAPPQISGLTGLQFCDSAISIDCIRAAYKLPINKSNHTNNQLGIAEWADYLYLPDLKEFFAKFTRPQITPDVHPEFISIDGGKPGDRARLFAGETGESALDFQLAYSIIYPEGVRQYQIGDGINVDSVGTFNIFLDALDESYCSYEGGDQPYIDPAYPDPNDGGFRGEACGGTKLSNVFTVSYGQIEGALPRFYQERQCNEWAKLALQGVSAIFASGDSGVANRYNAGYPDSCLNEKDGYVDAFGTRFSPSFPVNCPYITAVGATTTLGKNITDGEQAVYNFGSGGGFSNIFTAPSYQKHATQNYLKKYAPKYGDNVFNSTGRGFPDVAAFGDNILVVNGGSPGLSGGTSASAPIFASVITLLNGERIARGKGPIGFLNPTIYKYPQMFNDVIFGENPGCGTLGFPTAQGWDPVTGMGTPNYEEMHKVFVVKLP